VAIERRPGQAFLHVFTPPVRLVIVGVTHVGQVLVHLAARIGYGVVFVDPRTAFASQERIGEIMALTDWPEISLRALGRCRRFDPRRCARRRGAKRGIALGLPLYRCPGL
jgi:xanthine/CO dehydrogenase XdhC/CoxF family maturation factor